VGVVGDEVLFEPGADFFAEIGGAVVDEVEASDFFFKSQDAGDLLRLELVFEAVGCVVEADYDFGLAGFVAGFDGGADFVFGAGFSVHFGDGGAEALPEDGDYDVAGGDGYVVVDGALRAIGVDAGAGVGSVIEDSEPDFAFVGDGVVEGGGYVGYVLALDGYVAGGGYEEGDFVERHLSAS
jgi:hypothetical protein